MARQDSELLPLFSHNDKAGQSIDQAEPRQRHERTRRRYFRGLAFATLGLLLVYFQSPRLHQCFSSSYQVMTNGIGLPKKVQRAWTAHSPYYPADEYHAPPERCEITQVNLLQRHGSRFPTAGNSKDMKKSLKKLTKAKSYAHKRYEFLKNFEWDLGEADLLPIGAKEAFDSGEQHYLRYKHLLQDGQLPFVRASDSERVIYSAANWSEGFAMASAYDYRPKISVIISEESGANNTLDDSMCPNAKTKKKAANTWRDKFAPPIVKRFNKAVKGAKLDNDDIIEIMPLCAFETLYHGTASPLCSLFTEKEWLQREYYDDLTRYYKTGHGNELGPVQGTGYVNELLARLTGQPVQDATQTNSTLDTSPKTFPLNRNFYADFSHDNQMVAIYSALGLFRPDEPPSPKKMDAHRVWRISRMTPFSARMITEKLSCADEDGEGEKEYVRIFVNDALQPLKFCGAGKDGMCELEAFVESQAYSRSNGNGDWGKCFA